MQPLSNRRNLDSLISRLAIIGLACLLLFAIVAWLALTGKTLGIDDFLLTSLRHKAHPDIPLGSKLLLTAARDITGLGDVTLLATVTLFSLGYCLVSRYYTAFFMIFSAVNVGDLIMAVLKDTIQRPRPDCVPPLIAVGWTSFPSGHAMMSVIFYLTVGALLAWAEPRKTVKIYLLCITSLLPLMIGFTRVYLGVHYPSDVLAGWLAGLSWSTLSAAIVLAATKQIKSGANE